MSKISSYKVTTPQLVQFVGREDFVEAFKINLDEGANKILFVEGDGGIGKTRLLQHYMEYLKKNVGEDVIFPNKLIDLYHINVHDAEGLVRLLAEFLPPHPALRQFRRKINDLFHS